VIVDQLALTDTPAGRERSARVRWAGGELRVSIRAPAGLVADVSDASPFVAACLLPAMRCGEELEVDGPVSPLLLGRWRQARDLYRAWDAGLHGTEVRAAERLLPPPRAPGIGCFFSRGVDSTYSAAVPRGYPGPLTQLVFVDELEPRHDDSVRGEEVRRAQDVAARLELPLAVASTNLRELTDPFIGDWEDMAGAGLAALAAGLAGGLGHVFIPSTDGPMTVGPCGVSPLIDPQFSTESVAVHHDSNARSRLGKVAWLAAHRPDLIPGLKVCFMENRPDNCGRCGKCLLTMAALEAVGQLRNAEHFPDEISRSAIAELQLGALNERSDWADVLEALDPGRHAELRETISAILYRPAPSDPGELVGHISPAFRYRHSARALALLRDGRPWPSSGDDRSPEVAGSDDDRSPGEAASDDDRSPGEASSDNDRSSDLVGLVRAVDRRARRHLYGAGSAPGGELVGELGSLVPADRLNPPDGSDAIPLWLTPEGYLVTDGRRAARPRPAAAIAVRWVLAPLTWAGGPGAVGQRVRASFARVADLLGGSRSGLSPPAGGPLGYLHREAAPDRLPLFDAIHPVTGDQLLSTYLWDAVDLGYGEPTLLGYLQAEAPVTSRLGASRPWLPWASRFGQRVR
jgi:hypothetical protein